MTAVFHFLGTLEPLYVLSGVLVGGLVGMTGVGGGSLMTPILILLFGIHPATAVGTDLVYASVTKSERLRLFTATIAPSTGGWWDGWRWAACPATAATIAALYFPACRQQGDAAHHHPRARLRHCCSRPFRSCCASR